MQYNAIVLAAGQGKRMNVGKNKQFIHLSGQPLIIHTLARFAEDEWCQTIYLVINPAEKDDITTLLHSFDWKDRIVFVNGGEERQDSGYKGLQAVEGETDIVMIHDGARPFIETSYLHQLAEKADYTGAALLAVPVTDTIKQKQNTSLTTLDRQALWAAQTPQAFKYSIIKRAHDMARHEQYIGTDDSELVERLGQSVDIVHGSYQNVKLTTPEDIARAEAILNKTDKGER
ncbi:2-C-methyl-D-erythritol 4-phosphate cytidylyltransferase [Gracilibacillus halophilus]|uniref:2-C-methyl-D-erythritol 4-phosphate cytidylyltransferase n=1 Tax=Gracilibacillus halophilus TaxID=470864 RepID=UPI00058DE061|nr:2-C-methyl-D-erythritol 4-phosphate cytidylyltransferase [Gracilibacillus halophilus]